MNSIEAAKYLVALSDCKGDLLTNKKLQKLLYYAQAWHLVYFNGALLFEEQPQAWRHGPVYPGVYHYFKHFGYGPISLQDEYEAKATNCEGLINSIASENDLSEQQQQFLSDLLLKYGRLSAFALEVLSHEEKPWIEQREGLSEFDRGDRIIPFEVMRHFYGSKRKKAA